MADAGSISMFCNARPNVKAGWVSMGDCMDMLCPRMSSCSQYQRMDNVLSQRKGKPVKKPQLSMWEQEKLALAAPDEVVREKRDLVDPVYGVYGFEFVDSLADSEANALVLEEEIKEEEESVVIPFKRNAYCKPNEPLPTEERPYHKRSRRAEKTMWYLERA